jgi:hypothetical protein
MGKKTATITSACSGAGAAMTTTTTTTCVCQCARAKRHGGRRKRWEASQAHKGAADLEAGRDQAQAKEYAQLWFMEIKLRFWRKKKRRKRRKRRRRTSAQSA